MKILHIISSVDPKSGGPMEGIRQRGMKLIEMGHQVEVVSLDSPECQFISEYGLKVYALGPSIGGYRYNSKLIPWLVKNSSNYDAVIVNGLWQFHSYAAWRALHQLKIPYFVFTHGMLDPWFKYTYPLKHIKKWIYWPWAEYRVLRDASAVLFTSEEERLLARQSFWLYKVKEKVVSYGTKNPPMNKDQLREVFFQIYPQLREKRLFLFLSRIHQKKGCDLLIEAFAKVVPLDRSLHLLMAGPSNIDLQQALMAQAERLGISQHITWLGMLQGDLKWGAFYSSEVFVLPSHQENFGIAVAEALACSLPVLISNKVNIWREIETDGAGIVNADTVAGTESSLQTWLSKSVAARTKMATQAKTTFDNRFTVEAMAKSLIEVIKSKNTITNIGIQREN